MAVAPIRFFSPRAEQAAAISTLASANLAAANQTTTVGTFSAVLGQVLAALGPLALDNTLTNLGTGNNAGGTGGLANIVFTLLLLNSQGVGQNTATPPAVQQLLVTQLLGNTANNTDTSGLGSLGVTQFAAALAQQPGANNTLLTQLAIANTQPNPIIFSASALAQAFQIGNGTGLPA